MELGYGIVWSVPWGQQLDPSGEVRVDFEDRQQIALGWTFKAQHTEDMAYSRMYEKLHQGGA